MSRRVSSEQLMWQSGKDGVSHIADASPATALRKSMTEYTRYNATGLPRKLQERKVGPKAMRRSTSTGKFSEVVEIKEVPHIDLGAAIPANMRSLNGFEETPGRLPNIFVDVQGSKQSRVKVPLRQDFVRRSGAAPVAGAFEKYLSQELGLDVTSVFIPVRRSNAGARASLEMEQFEADGVHSNSYPFVAGMNIVVCINGDALDEEQAGGGAKCQTGCSIM